MGDYLEEVVTHLGHKDSVASSLGDCGTVVCLDVVTSWIVAFLSMGSCVWSISL